MTAGARVGDEASPRPGGPDDRSSMTGVTDGGDPRRAFLSASGSSPCREAARLPVLPQGGSAAESAARATFRTSCSGVRGG